MILLKWLKKITKWFKADEVIEIEEIVLKDDEHLDLKELENRGVKITTENKSTYFNKSSNGQEKSMTKKSFKEPVKESFKEPFREPSEIEKSHKNNEINAKISYQYPKGEFRFPVIPDYTQNVRKKPKVRKEVTNHNDLKREKTSVPLKRKNESKPVPIKVVPNHNVVNKVNERRRPFRATEIPSPVYGFHPKPKKEIVEEFEFELHSPTNEVNEKSLRPSDIPTVSINQIEEERVQDDFIQTVNTIELNEIDTLENTLEFPQKDETEVMMESNQTFVAGEPELDTTEIISIDSEKVEVKQQLVKEDVEKNIVSETNDMIKDTSEHELIENNVDEVIIEAISEEEIIHQEQTDISPIDANQEQTNISPVEVDQEQDPTLMVEREENIDIAPAVLPIEESTDNVQENVPKKKHIPFNVVMLRQDREKWKKQNELAEKKTINPSEQTTEQPVPALENKTIDDALELSNDDLPYYHFPSLDLLTPALVSESDDQWLDQQAFMLNETLHNFNVRAKVVNVTQGPAVTQFEVQPEPGVKVNKITNLTDDIKLCLAAQDIRMEAPIPGKHTIGIEIPNRQSRPVFLREILESSAFKESESPLTVALGLDITGAPIVTDLRKMPHGLIAGATGSGKSVCINTMLVSLLYKATPQELRVLLIDPKVVELAPYNSIPHLVSPVITDVKAATAALKWAVEEMDRRYELFAHTGVRDIQRFNKKAEEARQFSDKLPYIVIIIDELADLMMMSPAEVEESICRIAQKARACGIHLIVATQRPSVDVITGLIKANIPTRIAFSVSSQVDSRTIIDSGGAEKLLGRGDMLFLENGSSKTVRLQGTYVSDEEIEEVVDFARKEQAPQFLFQQEDLLAKAQISDERDELFIEACEFVVYQNAASASSLQRRFHIGYNRATRIVEMMESNGIISEARGSKPRDVLMTVEDLQEWLQLQTEQV